jgi:hypothetical protein
MTSVAFTSGWVSLTLRGAMPRAIRVLLAP